MTPPTCIQVTAEHIRRGVPRNCLSCPVTLALLDAFGEGAEVAVSHGALSARLGGTWYTADAPPIVRSFISDFDLYEPVAPFQFTVPEWRVFTEPAALEATP